MRMHSHYNIPIGIRNYFIAWLLTLFTIKCKSTEMIKNTQIRI